MSSVHILLPDSPTSGFPDGSVVKHPPVMQEMWDMPVLSLDQEDPLEEEMPTLSSILACKIPWTEEPGGLQSKESWLTDWVYSPTLPFDCHWLSSTKSRCYKCSLQFFREAGSNSVSKRRNILCLNISRLEQGSQGKFDVVCSWSLLCFSLGVSSREIFVIVVGNDWCYNTHRAHLELGQVTH